MGVSAEDLEEDSAKGPNKEACKCRQRPISVCLTRETESLAVITDTAFCCLCTQSPEG